MFCSVTFHREILIIISTKGDQLDGFTYLVACRGYIFIMILCVFFLIFVANKLTLSLFLSLVSASVWVTSHNVTKQSEQYVYTCNIVSCISRYNTCAKVAQHAAYEYYF